MDDSVGTKATVGGAAGGDGEPWAYPLLTTLVGRVGTDRRGVTSCGAEGGLCDGRMAVEAEVEAMCDDVREPQGEVGLGWGARYPSVHHPEGGFGGEELALPSSSHSRGRMESDGSHPRERR